MDQLDLFSSPPQPIVSKKKEANNAVEPTEQAINTDDSNEEIPVADTPPITDLATNSTDELSIINVEVPKHLSEAKVVDFADLQLRGEEHLEASHESEFNDEVKGTPVKKKNSLLKDGKLPQAKILQKRGRKSFKEMDAEVDLIEIPEDEILFKRQYYSISEVAGWFKVNTSLLRFWETEFDVLKPRKNRKGDRLFRPEDVKNLQLIYYLLRDRKYTIDGAKEYIKGNKKKADTQLQLTQSLQKFKSFLLELKANLQ